jgi:hypothetical protein
MIKMVAQMLLGPLTDQIQDSWTRRVEGIQGHLIDMTDFVAMGEFLSRPNPNGEGTEPYRALCWLRKVCRQFE